MNFNKNLTNPLPIFLITSLISLLYFFVLYDTAFFSSPRVAIIDTLFMLRAQQTPPQKHLNEVVIVGVDDESYQKMNRSWPWGREMFAVFLEHMETFNPKIIGLDFSFVGRGENGKVDAWFAETLRKSKKVVLGSYFSPSGRYMVPLESFRQAAAAIGFVDKTIDQDASARKTRVIIPLKTGQETTFSFAAEIACAYLGLPISQNVRKDGDHLLLRNSRIPTDPNGHFWLSYRYRSGDFKYIPFWKIIANKASIDEIEDKIVLVGLVSDLSHDIHNTPLGRLAGIFINANEIVALLDEDFITDAFQGYYSLFVWILALIGALIFYHSNFLIKILTLVCSETLLYTAAAYTFIHRNILFEPFSPMLMIGFAFLCVVSYEGLKTFLENETLQKMVIMDSLTGLYGYGYLNAKLERELEASTQSGEEFCFVMIDVDNFKQVNDRFGHEQGNALLVMVANVLKNGVRSKDIVGRYGGDELGLILKTKEKESLFCLERIKSTVEKSSLSTSKGSLAATISAGICSSKNPQVKTKNDLIRLADEALYQAKSQGRNRICIYPSSP